MEAQPESKIKEPMSSLVWFEAHTWSGIPRDAISTAQSTWVFNPLEVMRYGLKGLSIPVNPWHCKR